MEVKFPHVEVQLSGQNGNAFNLIGLVSRALKRAGHRKESKEFTEKCFTLSSYDEVIQECMRWVDVT